MCIGQGFKTILRLNGSLGGLRRRRQWHPTLVLLPGESHGRRSLVGCSPWGRWGSDTTKRLHFHFSLWCIGEGNGNPLQCSCLENPRDRGAWWAAVYGVAQNLTRLKQLSSSSSSRRRTQESAYNWSQLRFATREGREAVSRAQRRVGWSPKESRHRLPGVLAPWSHHKRQA